MVRSRRFPYSLFGLALILGAALAAGMTGGAAMLMTPYLQAVTADSAYVLVECDSTAPVTARYGPAGGNYGLEASTESTEPTAASPVTYVHNVKLTGLKPNTAYGYQILQGAKASPSHTFTTAALPGTAFRFAWMADCRTQPEVHDEIAGRIKEMHPRFALYGGDLCENNGYEFWKRDFFVPNQLALAAEVPFFNAAGNHEGWSTNTRAFTQAPASASESQAYYSFDYGDVHFVCLNNEISYAPGSPQVDFLVKDLTTTKKPWKIVFVHRPAYSLGGNGEDPGMKLLASYVFEPCRIDLVLNGHNHFYQHNLVNGLHYFNIGSAGAPLDNAGTGSYVVKAVKDHNFAMVDMTPTTLRLTAYNGKGAVIEVFTLTKTERSSAPVGPIVLPPAPPPVPPVVTSVIAKKATWKYYPGDREPDPAWKERTFGDGDWVSSNGPLGFGYAGLGVQLPPGRRTYYLRKIFSLSGDPSKYTKLTLHVNYDDGFVLYLNGKELARRAMPNGSASYATPALGHAAGAYEAIDLGHIIEGLTKGVYCLAVEVHQKEADNTGLFWDAELVSERPPT